MQNSQLQPPKRGTPSKPMTDDHSKTLFSRFVDACAPILANAAAARGLAVSFLLIICLTNVNVGCNRPMLSRYSSLRPKTASLQHASETIRAQNYPAPTAQQSALYQSVEGAAATENQAGFSNTTNTTTTYRPAVNGATPTARLLAPQFNAGIGTNTSPPTTVTSSAAVAGFPVAGPVSTSSVSTASGPANSVTGSGLPSSSGHSIGFDADSVRRFMNAQSSNPMSAGTVLEDKVPVWNNVSESRTAEPRGIPQNVPAEATSPPAVFGHLDQPETDNTISAAWNGVDGAGNPPAPNPPAPNQTLDIHPEPSMLDRLKEFYGPDGESSARQIWKRNIQKLQSPFSAFRDRDRAVPPAAVDSMETAEPIVDQSAVELPDPGSAADLLLDQLIDELNRELQSWPQQLSGRPLNPVAFQRRSQDLQMLYLIARQPSQAVASLSVLPDGEQAFWQEMMLALAQYREDANGANRERQLALTAQQLQSAARHLSMFGELGFKRLDICSRIHSFGRVVPFPSNDFRTGDPILLYAELDNFSTDITSQGKYRTNFDAQLQVLHDNSLDAIETIELTDITDESTSERTDYFQSFELTIPSHLTPGSYRIRVRLRDRISKKTAEGFVNFDIVGS